MQLLVDRAPLAIALFVAVGVLWLLSELRIQVRNGGGTGENLDRGSRELLTVIGLSLALGNWLSCVVATLFALAGLARRIAVEERALAEHLGPEWAAFAQTRKRLIPMVW